jgi:hypothetical protein
MLHTGRGGGVKRGQQVTADPRQLRRVQQEHPLHSGECRRPGARVSEVEPDHLEAAAGIPEAGCGPGGVDGGDPDPRPSGRQLGHQRRADVAGSTRDENSHRRRVRPWARVEPPRRPTVK